MLNIRTPPITSGFVLKFQNKNAKGDEMFVLESWNPDGLQKSYNLTDLDLHGPGLGEIHQLFHANLEIF